MRIRIGNTPTSINIEINANVEAETKPGLLELRPHPRASRRLRKTRRNRLEFSRVACRRDILSHDTAQRIRYRGNVAVFVFRLTISKAPTIHRDSRLSFAPIQALLHLRQRGGRHP